MAAKRTRGRRQRVLVLGDVVADVIARPDGAVNHGSDTPAGIAMTPGGSAANFAVAAARAGAYCLLIGAVGDDPAGRWLAGDLRRSGVDTGGLVHVREARTGMLVALIDPSGERSMLIDKGANRFLRPEHVREEHFQVAETGTPGARTTGAPGLLHLTGYSFYEDGPRPAALRALTLARAAGWAVSFDPSSAAPLKAHTPRRLLAELGPVDFILANAEEAALLSGLNGGADDPIGACRALLGRARVVAVKLGRDGCCVGGPGLAEPVVIPPSRALAALDTTGAGDAFDAAFVLGALAGMTLTEAGDGANSRAAATIGVLGAREDGRPGDLGHRPSGPIKTREA